MSTTAPSTMAPKTQKKLNDMVTSKAYPNISTTAPYLLPNLQNIPRPTPNPSPKHTQTSYYDMMKKSQFCLCPSGYEVASPRVVEALYAACVPVLLSSGYVPPFSDVLNWKVFSVIFPVEDIPNLKDILARISSSNYIRDAEDRCARKHLVVNLPPKRYDVYHMILHSIWLRRLNVRIHDGGQCSVGSKRCLLS